MDGYKGNGLYTHTLLQGIANGRDVDKEKSGKVTVKNLGLYTKEKTTEISTKLGHPQTPYIINFGRDNPFFVRGSVKMYQTWRFKNAVATNRRLWVFFRSAV